jgi:hypothetical protein
MFNDHSFRENLAIYETNGEKYCGARCARDDNIIQRMRFACWISKVPNTQAEYVIFIAFPLQQWLRERASKIRDSYIACLVSFDLFI